MGLPFGSFPSFFQPDRQKMFAHQLRWSCLPVRAWSFPRFFPCFGASTPDRGWLTPMNRPHCRQKKTPRRRGGTDVFSQGHEVNPPLFTHLQK
jgi:hypothetical protein